MNFLKTIKLVIKCVLLFILWQLVTLFSAPNYCGEFDNAGAVMIVTEDLTCSFKILPVSELLTWVSKLMLSYCVVKCTCMYLLESKNIGVEIGAGAHK